MNQAIKKRMNPKVDEFIRNANKWQIEFRKLRAIILDCSLSEELKWAKPCYTYENNNIVILQGFKEFCAVLFPKGALLNDSKGILEKPGPNTQAARRIPFASVSEIVALEQTLKSYVLQAIKVEKAGLKVSYKETADYTIPKEFQNELNKNAELKKAFNALTPGRQRAYILYLSGAKQSKTRQARLGKCRERILNGKGLYDPYD